MGKTCAECNLNALSQSVYLTPNPLIRAAFQASEDVYLAIRSGPFSFEYRGIIHMDDKAGIKAYLITDRDVRHESTPRSVKSNRIPLPGLAKEASTEIRIPDRVDPEGSRRYLGDLDRVAYADHKGKPVLARLVGRQQGKQTVISAIPEVTDAETDIEDVPLLARHLGHERSRQSGKRTDDRKNSAPVIPTRLSRPENLSLSCSFNEHLDRMREKSVESFQQPDLKLPPLPQASVEQTPASFEQTPASFQDSVTAVINSPPNLLSAETEGTSERNKDIYAFDYSDLSDNNQAEKSPETLSAAVKRRFRRRNKKGALSQWKRASTTSSEFEFIEPSPSNKTPDKWQIRSFFRARTVSNGSATGNSPKPVASGRGQSPFSPISQTSIDQSASEFEMEDRTKEELIRLSRTISQGNYTGTPSPLDRTGYLAAVYGIPKQEQQAKHFLQTNVPVSKPLGIVYPLPSPACSGYGSEKHSQHSPRTQELLNKLSIDSRDHLGPNMSPMGKPFPLGSITQFIDSPDLAYTTATNLTASNNTSQGVTPGSDSIRNQSRANFRKMFSETEYDNAESDHALSESEFVSGNFSPESRMLRQPRLLVPGYNLSVIDNATEPLFQPRFTRDDSCVDIMFGPGSLRRKALGSLQSLDYLGIDTGNEADVDSLASSRCSSRMFSDPIGPGYNWQPDPQFFGHPMPNPRHFGSLGDAIYRQQPVSRDAPPLGYDSEYDNFRPGMLSDEDAYRPEPVSDMEIDFFDHDGLANLRKVTADIQKSFGDVQLSTYSDGESPPV